MTPDMANVCALLRRFEGPLKRTKDLSHLNEHLSVTKVEVSLGGLGVEIVGTEGFWFPIWGL